MASRSSVAELDQYQWERLPDMSSPRCYTVGAYHEGKLYSIGRWAGQRCASSHDLPPHIHTHACIHTHTHTNSGGCDIKGTAVNVAEVYDFATKKWSFLPEMPTKRAASTGAIVRENKIIVIGGVNHKQVPIAAVDCFNIATQKWEHFPPLPIGVVGPFVKLIDDMIYVIGGTDKKGCNQSVVFDFDRDEWLPLPSKPTACYSCGGYLFERKLYIVGGRDGQTPVKACEVFDLETKQWETLAPMTSIRVFYSVVGYKDSIFVIGGLVPMVGICKIAESYSIRENKWTRIKDLIQIRSDSAHGIVGGRVVVAGGLGGETLRAMDTAECIHPKGNRFKKLPNLSKERSSVTSLSFEGKLAIMNGVGEGGVQPIVEILSVKDKDA